MPGLRHPLRSGLDVSFNRGAPSVRYTPQIFRDGLRAASHRQRLGDFSAGSRSTLKVSSPKARQCSAQKQQSDAEKASAERGNPNCRGRASGPLEFSVKRQPPATLKQRNTAGEKSTAEGKTAGTSSNFTRVVVRLRRKTLWSNETLKEAPAFRHGEDVTDLICAALLAADRLAELSRERGNI
jgi:hypothetical protein